MKFPLRPMAWPMMTPKLQTSRSGHGIFFVLLQMANAENPGKDTAVNGKTALQILKISKRLSL
jgi:hypothetical protein